jgi:phosphate/sulfate permease
MPHELPESNSSISLSAFAAAALISLGLGGNDAQKIMGIIAVLL